MHTFYYADHERHNPAQFSQYASTGGRYSYLELPERVKIIRDAVRAAQLGPIISPGDFGIEPIGEIHDYGMLNLLQSGYRLLRETTLNPPYVPDTFSVRTYSKHVPRSVLGLLGYYAFDTYAPILEHTWSVAYWSAQTAISAAALVLAGSDRIAYALCRPPGHHASVSLFGGYCYLNNAAIAANWLVQQGQRVAIVDIDYHHGNGTQSIFYNRSDVLFCSLHADPFNEYPYYWGYADEYGEGAGQNHNFNFPLPRGTQEAQYLRTLEQALTKVRLFVPDVVMVSLGLDVVEGDPDGGFRLVTSSLAAIGAMLRELDLPVVVVQEGGYRLDVLGESAVAFFQGLLGR
ncbi:MAG: histone deacetylase family protein [Ardenticatenaceae bacterium]|nr:histone deacetylase family protein [Ardenticatenaceae bacterium]